MNKTRSRLIAWGAVLAFALLVRVGAAVYWQARLPDDQQFAFPDSESYWELGERIARGEPYQFAGSQAFRTPGYPVLLSPLFVAFGEQPPVLAARIVGALLGVGVVAGVGVLAWKLFDERSGWIAALLCALYPGAIAMSILVLSEALFCLLMIGQLLLWAMATVRRSSKIVEKNSDSNSTALEDRRTLIYAALAGVLAGLATLTRPSWLLFTPFAVGVAVTAFPPRLRQLKIGAAMLCAMALTMSPWWLRNARVLGAFVPTTTQVGASLYDGLHAGATGASDMSFVSPMEQEFLQQQPNIEGSDNTQRRLRYEVQLNQHFAGEAIDWAKAHPTDAASLAVVKFARMWNIWPNEPSLRSWPVRWIVAIGYLPILVCALIGAWQFRRRGWPYVMCWLPAAYFTLLHMVFVGSIRYRQVPMLLLIVLAAGVVGRVCNSTQDE